MSSPRIAARTSAVILLRLAFLAILEVLPAGQMGLLPVSKELLNACQAFPYPGSFGFFAVFSTLAESPTSSAMIVEVSDDSSLSVEDADSLPASVGAIMDLASMVEDKDGLRRAVEVSGRCCVKSAFLSSSEHVGQNREYLVVFTREIRELNAR